MINVLIIDDEQKEAEKIAQHIEVEGYKSSILHSGQHLVTQTFEEQPNIILLEAMLLEKDGYSICRDIKKFSDIPIIMLSKMGEENDRIRGLLAGADDYVCKPFSIKELMLRIKVILKRYGVEKQSQKDEIVLDDSNLLLNFKGKEVRLTHLEFAVASLLMKKSGRVFSRAQIIQITHNYKLNISERSIDSHIKNIRKKLRVLGANENMFESVYGAGFRFNLLS